MVINGFFNNLVVFGLILVLVFGSFTHDGS
jgi:hypothetical protein